MIIDSESSKNLASKELVTKLQLQRLKNPNHYHASWVKDQHKVLVSEQCLVKLKIGPFIDEVLCNAMPMECCHILLGRPWKFDRCVVYDGRVNKYTTRKDGVKYTLLPLIETPNEMSCIVRVYMVTRKEFEKAMKKNYVCFAIIPKRLSSTSGDRVIDRQ